MNELLKGKTVILTAVPGAYTSVCTGQMGDYAKKMSLLKKAGVDEVMCYGVNDPYTMKAWAESMNIADIPGLSFYGDHEGGLTKELGMDIPLSHCGLGGVRSNR